MEKVAVIVGASSGLGEFMARDFARRGFGVALLARRKARIESLASELVAQGKRALPIVADVTDEKTLKEAFSMARAKMGRIDIVVANAGFSVSGRVDLLSVDDFKRQLDTNLFGVLRTYYACQSDLKKNKGCFGIVGSVNSFIAVPGGAPYGVSKFAVRALANSLFYELKPFGVGVTLLAPGFVESEIRRVDNHGRFRSEAKDPIPSWLQMSTQKAATQMVTAILRRRPEKIITGHGKLIVWLTRFFPSFVFFMLSRIRIPPRKEALAS